MWSDAEPAPYRVPVTASRTASSWVIAATPAVVFGSWLVALASPAGLSWALIAVTVGLASALGVVLATADVRALTRAGYDRTANPFLATIPVLYLFHRGHLCAVRNFEGYGPGWLHVGIVSMLVLIVSAWELFFGASSVLSLFDDLIGRRVTP
jgi:hypothetical protein